jgi:hypothetical protein
MAPGNRPDDRMHGTALSERTQKLISRLFTKSEGSIVSDLLIRSVSNNIPFYADSNPEQLEPIRFAVIKMTKESPLNLAVGIYLAQTDWRDLLMSAGFGDDTSQHMAWYHEQMNTGNG